MSPFIALMLFSGLFAAIGFGGELRLILSRKEETSPGSREFKTSEEVVDWQTDQTAFLICDMWDKHWCASASQRVDELAPIMNTVLRAARDRGVLIIHAPSDTMPFYDQTPERQRAKSAPTLATEPEDIARWKPLDPTRESPLPVDDSDGGCDDLLPCPTYRAWTCQHPALQIEPEDAISDNGAEVYRLLAQRHIENIIVMGVHTNFCILGRSFGIRSLVTQGKNVALMRDMTDCLYNPRMAPYVSHSQGTDLIINHIETYWCPTITSDQIVGGEPFRFRDAVS